LFSLSWNLKYHIRTHMSEKPTRDTCIHRRRKF
jgi:hypothetical protein